MQRELGSQVVLLLEDIIDRCFDPPKGEERIAIFLLVPPACLDDTSTAWTGGAAHAKNQQFRLS